jgi:hypothetical protein
MAVLPYSDDFVRAARVEADTLRLEVERLREALVLEHRARELDELLGRAPQLRLDLQPDSLRGQRLREAAVEILVRRHGLGEPIHYRDWFKLLLAEGVSVEGKDPLATFLTQVTRSPVVLRQRDRPGVYRVDPEAGGEGTLRELHDARSLLVATERRIDEARERADERALEDLTRQLAEAERRAGAAERALSEVARVQAALRALAA